MDVLLFGGSFDPPHAGHRLLLEAGLKALDPERAYVIPTHRSPLKPGPRAGGPERLRLLAAALGVLPAGLRRRARVHRYELDRGRTTYTYQTLRFFRRLHPKATFHLLAGSDVLESFPRWRAAEELKRGCRLLLGLREGARRAGAGGHPPARWLPGRFPEVSSSEVRVRLLCGQEASGLLDAPVLELARALGLYGLDIHAALERELSPERYRHTLCVAREARVLARGHGESEERAALAGLLHDCGRALSLPALAAYARRRRLRAPGGEDMARRNPLLLHAYVGADMARGRFGVRDREVLGAVRKHTLGDLSMTRLERILYVADACSADRAFREARGLRALARRDLDAAFMEALRLKLDYALRGKSWLHPMSLRLWNKGLDA